MNDWKLPIIILAVVVLFLGGIYAYFNFQKPKTEPVIPSGQSQGPTQEPTEKIERSKGSVEYEETETQVVVGSKEVSKGNFDRVEGGNIFYSVDGVVTQLPLTTDEVVLSCTGENLKNIKELDLEKVTKVHIETAATIGSKIAKNEQIVVFAADVDGVFRAHSVVVSAAACP